MTLGEVILTMTLDNDICDRHSNDKSLTPLNCSLINCDNCPIVQESNLIMGIAV